jgi:hypothetical protein
MRDPDLIGPRGRAWRLPPPTTPGAAGVALYLLNCPQAHSFWQWWTLSVIHLREQEGAPPPYRSYPKATHELLVLTVDPDRLPAPDPDTFAVPFPHLTPPDVETQFHVGDDDAAAAIAQGCVEACLMGHLSPDSDYRRLWGRWVRAAAAGVRDAAQEETP